MGPDVNGTFVQLNKDVGSSMQMVVVTEVQNGYHMVVCIHHVVRGGMDGWSNLPSFVF